MRQRRREVGIRLALGATAANIVWLVVRRTFAPTEVGLGLGLAASYFGGRLVASLIGVGPTDPASFATAVIVLVAAAGAASLLPAVVALRVAPGAILRRE